MNLWVVIMVVKEGALVVALALVKVDVWDAVEHVLEDVMVAVWEVATTVVKVTINWHEFC